MSISTTIKSIQDIMRKDTGVDGDAQRIGQLVWMFFLKIYDDKETEYELLDDDYKSPIPEHLRWRNWAANPEGMTGDELLDFVNIQLFPTLKNLQPKGNDMRGYVIRGVFEDAYNYMKSGHLMRQVINKIVGGIDFNKAQDRHLFGDMYEQILRDLQNAGNAGEYYTPRPVTQFMVDMVAPQLGEKIMDPACGTGGFLTCAIEYVRKQHVKTVEHEQLLQQSIFGVEKKPLPHLLCTTNMILHGIDVPTNVRHDNTLARPLRDYGQRDRVDVILSNPPFGGMEEDGIENNFPATFRTRETADLFLVLIMHLLKDGGRAAVVLPDGTLFGEGIKTRIKEQLLETCNLHTVVRLPNGVFSPYTGIKTNLLFFTKGTPTEEVWFYEHPYPVGYKNYSKTKPMRIEEFVPEKTWWNDRVENEFAWKVSAGEIKARNYNLDIKNPHSPDAVRLDPEMLLAEYAQLAKRIAETRDQLKAVFAAAGLTTSLRRFTEQFETFFTTESSVNALKKGIMQLAVMGKLVPQDSTDEAASELLKRIAQERARLEMEGICKKSKSVPAVAEDERPFDIPGNWAWERIGNYVLQTDYGLSEKTFESNDGVPVLKMGDIQEGKIILGGQKSVPPTTEGLPYLLLEPGDLLYNRTNSAELVGKTGIFAGPPQCFSFASYLIRIRCAKGMVSADFLNLAMNAPMFRETEIIPHLKQQCGQANVNGTILRSMRIPVPPAAEQERIVAKVSELLALCDRIKADLVESRWRQERLASTLIEAALKAA